MNTTDREEQLVEVVYSVLGYEHADNITKCRHVANKILAWHEQKMAEAVENKHCEHCTMRGNLRKLSRAVEKAPSITDEKI